ncbi:hypothetical protein FOZ61_003756 [Perkinsus olseni]|uniref:Uncharacterized protein n=1 Tax=Perkinsus olseni TaxID=32597 RepID=A0A7J6LNI6_PEROL|nr:hypothetical protein FOZ61_003756 [Perkinsus olseni]
MATAASAAQDGLGNGGKDRTLNIEIVLHKSARQGRGGGKWRGNPNATLSIVKDASAGPELRWRRPTPLEVVVDDQEKGGGVQVVSPASTLPAMGVNYCSGSGGGDDVVRARTPSPVQASIQRVTSSSETKYASSGTGSREKLELMRRRVFGESGHHQQQQQQLHCSSASPASTIELPAAGQHEDTSSVVEHGGSLVTSRAAGATDELTRQTSRLQAEVEEGRRSRQAMEGTSRRNALESSHQAVCEAKELTDVKQENLRLQAQAKLLEEDLAIAVKERGRSRGQRKGAEREAEDISLIAEREFTRNRLEAAEARCADLQAEVELLRIGSEKVGVMEAELASLSTEVDRLTDELEEERRNSRRLAAGGQGRAVEGETRVLKKRIAELEYLNTRGEKELETATAAAKVEAGRVRQLQDTLRIERGKVSELEVLLDTAKEEKRLSSASTESLQHQSIRDQSFAVKAEMELSKRREQLIETRKLLRGKDQELHEASAALRSAEERCQRLESRAEAAEKEVEVTRRQVEELRRRVKDLKLELSSLCQRVDRKSAELASVIIERDELSYELEEANEKLSSATEQMGILKAAVEQESSQRQFLTLQHHGLQEECDRLQSTVEKLDQINTENMLAKGQAEKRVPEYGEVFGDRVSTVASLGRSQRHVIDYARRMVTMSLEDYNAEAARVAELTDQLSTERRQLERLLDQVDSIQRKKECERHYNGEMTLTVPKRLWGMLGRQYLLNPERIRQQRGLPLVASHR